MTSGSDRSRPSVLHTPVVAELYDHATDRFHPVSQPVMSLECDQVAPPSLDVKLPHSGHPGPSRRTSIVMSRAGLACEPRRARIAPVWLESRPHTPPAWRPRHVD